MLLFTKQPFVNSKRFKLFNFNGVPRQILIGPDGKVIDDDLKAHHISILTDRLNKYGVILK